MAGVSHKAAEVEEVVDKFEQLGNVVGDGGPVRVELSQVLLIDLADSCKSQGETAGVIYDVDGLEQCKAIYNSMLSYKYFLNLLDGDSIQEQIPGLSLHP